MKGKENKNLRIRVKMESKEFGDLLEDKNQSSDFHQDHHHKETFITKYIFSQDHKMIAKQYLINWSIVYGFYWNCNVSII